MLGHFKQVAQQDSDLGAEIAAAASVKRAVCFRAFEFAAAIIRSLLYRPETVGAGFSAGLSATIEGPFQLHAYERLHLSMAGRAANPLNQRPPFDRHRNW